MRWLRNVLIFSVVLSASASLADETEMTDFERWRNGRREVERVQNENGMEWGYHAYLVLSDTRVRNALEVSPGQQQEIQAITAEHLRSVVALMKKEAELAKSQNRIPLVKKNDPAVERERQQRALEKRCDEAVERVLDAEQRTRLRQVKIQLRSVEAFYYPALAQTLSLTEAQQGAIFEIRQSVVRDVKRITAVPRQAKPETVKWEKEVDQIFSKAKARVLESLNDEQRELYSELIGVPFNFSRSDLSFVIRSRPPDPELADEPPK